VSRRRCAAGILEEARPCNTTCSASFSRNNEAFVQEVRAAGAWVFGGRLHAPSTATVVRVRGDEVLTTDGPFAEGKEHLAGVLVIRAPDLDAALEWGRKQAQATTLPIEVRPFHSAGEG
jgi:hypothetical protein